MRTLINGLIAPWPPEIAALWATHQPTDLKRGQSIDCVNYFDHTPADGRHRLGFTYALRLDPFRGAPMTVGQVTL